MRTSDRLIATTTNGVPGYSLVVYAGVVTAHVVAGTSVFSDIAGNFRDIFGGRSRSYQKQLADIDDEVIAQLEQRARRLGANAIIGLRIDHDEVSGGGKQMFMVTATGTAVRIEQERSPEREGPSHDLRDAPRVFDAEEVLQRRTRRYLIEKAEAETLELNEEDWSFITRHAVAEVCPAVVRHVTDAIENATQSATIDHFYAAYFGSLPRETSIEALYPLAVHRDPRIRRFAHDLIEQLALLDLERVDALLRDEDLDVRKRALGLLDFDKPAYTVADAQAYDAIAELIPESFPDRWTQETKTTFTGKEKTVVTCHCGNSLLPTEEYCTQCRNDSRGFLRNERKPGSYVTSARWCRDAIMEASREAGEAGDRDGPA